MIWLAFDIGTTQTKAALLDGDSGCILAHAAVSYPPEATTSAPGGVSEQQPRAWSDAAIAAARQLDCTQVEGIALTGQMQDVILIDSGGQPVRPAILYNDTRAQAQAAAMRAQQGGEQLRAITGNDQDAASLIAKLLWLGEHEAAQLGAVAHLLLGAADYLAFMLTGIAQTDTTTASTTGLMNIGAQMFWVEQVEPLAAQLLPALAPGGAQVGDLRVEAAASLGVRAGIPVHLGPGDAGASTIGVGSGEGGQPYAYIGTSGWVGFTSDRLYPPETGVFNLAHPAPGRFFNVAPLLTAGGNLDFAARLFGAGDYDALIEAAVNTKASRLLYLPYLNGERSPFRDPNARGAFIGLEPGHTPAHLTRAVLEGVAFAYRHALEALLPAMPDALTITGGAARSAAWMQLLADVLGTRIHVAADAEFTGVRGAVIAAQCARHRPSMIPTDAFASYAPEGWFAVDRSFAPNADRVRYDEQYGRFREAYIRLKTLF